MEKLLTRSRGYHHYRCLWKVVGTAKSRCAASVSVLQERAFAHCRSKFLVESRCAYAGLHFFLGRPASPGGPEKNRNHHKHNDFLPKFGPKVCESTLLEHGNRCCTTTFCHSNDFSQAPVVLVLRSSSDTGSTSIKIFQGSYRPRKQGNPKTHTGYRKRTISTFFRASKNHRKVIHRIRSYRFAAASAASRPQTYEFVLRV